jgi:hypothetical protein
VKAGYSIAGKNPLAVFLTQLTRSPLVCKSTQTGVYALDRSAPARLQHRLEELGSELRGLASGPTDADTVSALRDRRRRLNLEIGQVERALEEALRVLENPDGVRLRAVEGGRCAPIVA